MLADVEGLNHAQLKVAVWSGNVTLKDVRLRREACYALGLPVHIKLGCVQSVQVTIPWSKLGSEPVTITLDGVCFVAGPLSESNWDEEAQSEWAWARKQGRLNRLEQAAEMSSIAAKAAAAGGSPTKAGAAETPQPTQGAAGGTLLAKVLHNLQLRITNLHMRYEDSTSSAGSPFAIGVTLKELAAFTTDGAGNRRFCTDPGVQHKWIELQDLAVYHHVDCDDSKEPRKKPQTRRRLAEWR